MGFQQILTCVAVQAALADVLAPLVLALIVEEAVEVLDPGVVKFAGLFNQQYIVPSNIQRLVAIIVNFYAAVPAKYIDGFIKQFFEFWNLRDGRWGVNFRRAIFTFLAA